MKKVLLSSIFLFTGCHLGFTQKVNYNNKIHEQMADTINKYVGANRVSVHNNEIYFGFIFDLTDTTNNRKNGKKGELVVGHWYHFGYKRTYKSYSHLCFYVKDKSQFFSNVYCDSTSFHRALAFYQEMKSKYKSEQILENIKNYRHFGKYYNTDSGPLYCK